MKAIFLTSILSFCLHLFCLGQTNAGGRPTAMAGAYVAASDAWSAFHNQAGLATIEQLTLGAFYENRFGLNSLSDKGFLAVYPLKGRVFALHYHSFGDANFSSSKTAISYAMKLGEKLQAGVQLDYFSIRLGENYGRQTGFTAEIGFQYRVHEKLSLAAHLSNPNRAHVSEYIDERLPTIMRAGALMKLSDRVLISGEIHKSSGIDPALRLAVEYRFIDQASLRAGFGSNPGTYTFGFGWKIKSFLIDMAAAYHPILGFNPHLSLTFSAPDKP